ncbi:hypothetical protein [Halotalea alkalilenta]|uniref:hypothetical protein n=1 Tax=Halotalea alkalilenta TaxID=376489 RepID=UPI0012DE0181|nr:hypothetical protein [Halotalea alkalilenta]
MRKENEFASLGDMINILGNINMKVSYFDLNDQTITAQLGAGCFYYFPSSNKNINCMIPMIDNTVDFLGGRRTYFCPFCMLISSPENSIKLSSVGRYVESTHHVLENYLGAGSLSDFDIYIDNMHGNSGLYLKIGQESMLEDNNENL